MTNKNWLDLNLWINVTLLFKNQISGESATTAQMISKITFSGYTKQLLYQNKGFYSNIFNWYNYENNLPGVSEQACNIRILLPSSPIIFGPLEYLMAERIVLTSTTPLPSVSNCWKAWKRKMLTPWVIFKHHRVSYLFYIKHSLPLYSTHKTILRNTCKYISFNSDYIWYLQTFVLLKCLLLKLLQENMQEKLWTVMVKVVKPWWKWSSLQKRTHSDCIFSRHSRFIHEHITELCQSNRLLTLCLSVIQPAYNLVTVLLYDILRYVLSEKSQLF